MDYFRNYKNLVSLEGLPVKSGSLWKKKGWLMTLIDVEDRYMYITDGFESSKFYEIRYMLHC